MFLYMPLENSGVEKKESEVTSGSLLEAKIMHLEAEIERELRDQAPRRAGAEIYSSETLQAARCTMECIKNKDIPLSREKEGIILDIINSLGYDLGSEKNTRSGMLLGAIQLAGFIDSLDQKNK